MKDIWSQIPCARLWGISKPTEDERSANDFKNVSPISSHQLSSSHIFQQLFRFSCHNYFVSFKHKSQEHQQHVSTTAAREARGRSRVSYHPSLSRGGHDSGATCAGKQEKDIVLGITKRLYKEFKSEGYKVYLTRSSDRFLTLGQRTRLADKKDAAVFISIHANAIADTSRFVHHPFE